MDVITSLIVTTVLHVLHFCMKKTITMNRLLLGVLVLDLGRTLPSCRGPTPAEAKARLRPFGPPWEGILGVSEARGYMVGWGAAELRVV